MAVPSGFKVQTLSYDDPSSIQGSFANSMSNTISQFINRNRRNPLQSLGDRYELGLTGGAARISDTLYIPPTEKFTGPTTSKLRKKRTRKRKTKRLLKRLGGAKRKGKKKKKKKKKKKLKKRKSAHKRKTQRKKRKHAVKKQKVISHAIF